MEHHIIAYCGLDCAQCDGYKATQANDEAWKERVAAQWREEFKNPVVDAAYVTCDGCLSTDGRLGGHCLECKMRTCGISHGVANCAECAEFETCADIQGFLQFVPSAKANLDAWRKG